MRQLKHHEKKLLRKVDFVQWKHDDNIREIKILRRYLIQDREDYVEYNKLCGVATRLARRLMLLPPDNGVRLRVTEQLLEKLYAMGLIDATKSLHKVDHLTASSFCRRRLPVVLVRLKMAENLRAAVELVEAGHVRVGPNVVTRPSFIVTRSMEDFVTWVDSSKIKRVIQKYNDKLDDYELLGE